MKWLIFILVFLMNGWTSSLQAQDDFLYTRKFTRLLERHNLEFYLPKDRWMKLTNKVKDDYSSYDAVFHSPPDVEVRIIIDKDSDRMMPNVEIVRIITNLTTNEEDSYIEFTEYPYQMSQDRYGADFALYADFKPKETVTSYANGRVLCLFKEGGSLVRYVILYDGYLDPYFRLPLRFAN